MSADTDPLLRLDRITAGYGTGSVLDDVSIDLDEGEIVTVLGPNGAGKTTLLRVISSVVPINSGSVEFRGQPIHKLGSHVVSRSGIGHVPEGRAIFPSLSVAENLELGTFAVSKDAAYDREAELERVLHLFPRLRDRWAQRGGTLSGGEQQMLAIARSLMGKPTVLLLDEPSLGLAPLIVQQVFELLPRIREVGVAILLVEQNLPYALSVADRGYVLNQGRVVVEGSVDELRASDLYREYVGA